MCFSPQRRAIFQHLNFKKWSEPDMFCTFSLQNVLLVTAACNFSTSELQKVVWDPQFFNILTWKCASRHNGVQFFNISTAKSGPELMCFVHFHFKMCFSPQRRAIFQHLNCKKWPGADVFCTFSLQNVLLTTAACYFWTSQLQKVVRSWCVLYIFTSKCDSHHSGVLFLISPLTTWLRTRRFNEPTFRLTRHTNHWKNTAFRDFSNIWRGWIFFLLTFALLQLLSSDSTSPSDFTFFWLYFIYLLFICFSTLHIVGSLLFKLPSINFIVFIVWLLLFNYYCLVIGVAAIITNSVICIFLSDAFLLPPRSLTARVRQKIPSSPIWSLACVGDLWKTPAFRLGKTILPKKITDFLFVVNKRNFLV